MQLVGGAPTDVSVINARKYHLTYAALGRGELSNEDVLSQLTVKRGVDRQVLRLGGRALGERPEPK